MEKIAKKIDEFPGLALKKEDFSWDSLYKSYSWVQDMHSVPQDAIFHAEGDVGTHTRMVIEAMFELQEYKSLSDEDKKALFIGCLLHDVEKRSTTSEEDGRIVSPGHAKKGEYTARQILYRDIPLSFQLREKICKLVRHHGLPLWIFEKATPIKTIMEASIISNTKLLELIATADVNGRVCPDADELHYRIALFKELALEHKCYNQAKLFHNDFTRYVFFDKENFYPDYVPYDDTKFKVILMSGIPGSGKDMFIKNYYEKYPVVSLDELRREHKIAADDKSGTGTIIQMAKEKAKEFMRKHQSFVWNGTNLTKQTRSQLVELFTSYGGKVKIVYVEVDYNTVLFQNANREHPIPNNVLEKFINKVEIPSPFEAHKVEYYINRNFVEYATRH